MAASKTGIRRTKELWNGLQYTLIGREMHTKHEAWAWALDWRLNGWMIPLDFLLGVLGFGFRYNYDLTTTYLHYPPGLERVSALYSFGALGFGTGASAERFSFFLSFEVEPVG
jgi:hypothetical protein